MALQQPSADDLRQAIEEEAALLDGEGAAVQHALANLCVLVSRLEDGMALPAALTSRTERVQAMLQDKTLQENAISLLTAMLCLDDAAWEQLVNNGYVPQAVEMLAAAAAAAAQEDAAEGGDAPAASSTLQLNLVASMTEVARRSDEGAHALVAAGGLDPILALCSPRAEPNLAEAAVDALCCLASCEALRPTLTEAGTVHRLGALLGTPGFEMRVRALLALGMLLPGSERNQLDLASTPGVAQHLMASMQQKKDLDCKMIARDVFTTLVQNPLCRDLVEASLRSTAER